jgi:transposase
MTVIGMDVHQRYCQVALLDDDSSDPDEQRLKTERDELEEFAREHEGAHVAFEATRNHWFVYDCLEEHLDVTVANPAKIGLIGDQPVKNDRLDAKRLAVLLRAEALPTSYVPPDELREARKLVRQRKALVEDRTSAKNRVQATLADRGITYNGELFCQKGREFLLREELPLSAADHDLIETDLAVIDSFDEQIGRLTAQIDELAVTWGDTQLMMTIPGIGAITAATIKAEVGEFERFDHKTEVVSYAGLDPAVRQSGEKETTGGITKEGSSLLRWALGQGALNAAGNDPYLGNYYSRLKQHKPNKKALTATARKLLVMIYAMITKQEEYNPPGATPS